jgi:tetratricopeptide (TPR) repeat protein
MGNAMQALGRLSEALAYQEKSLAADSNNALAWANKAVTLSGLNRRPEAISCYDRSLALDAGNKITWFNKGVALLRLGKHSEAIQCLDHILENLDPRMKNALGAKSEILNAAGRTEEAAKCIERMKEIDAEGEPFSFASVRVKVDLFGDEVDTRQVLRGIETHIRQRTGLSQVAADFQPSGKLLEPTNVTYSDQRGYRITLQLSVFSGELDKEVEHVVEIIQNHARKTGVRSSPPPIPGTETNVHPDLNFDTHSNHYEALAHDGGFFVAFYREKQGNRGVLQRHVSPLGFVHYRFSRIADYKQLLRDAAEHCSAFLDLSYLDGEDMNQDTLRVFLSEHKLYGWGSKES